MEVGLYRLNQIEGEALLRKAIATISLCLIAFLAGCGGVAYYALDYEPHIAAAEYDYSDEADEIAESPTMPPRPIHTPFPQEQIEAWIAAINAIYPLHASRLGIYETSDEQPGGFVGRTRLFVEKDCLRFFGMIVYKAVQPHVDGMKLPFWLLAGVEAMVRRDLQGDWVNPISSTLNIPPDFGDLSFFPSSRGSFSHIRAINTAYHFVVHLIENNYFPEIVQLFTNGDRHTADNMVAEIFYDFARQPLDGVVMLHYGRRIPGFARVSMYEEFSIAHFEFRDGNKYDMPENILRAYTRNSQFNEITRIIYEWFKRYADRPWSFARIIHTIHIGRPPRPHPDFPGSIAAAFGGGGSTVFYGTSRLYPRIVAHETTHAMDDQIFRRRSITPFYEGLAGFFEHYAAGVRCNHTRVTLAQINNIGELGGFRSRYFPANPHFIREIATYATSASFIQFLIETYGGAKLMQVYFNVSNFENVYGITLREMVDRWVDFIAARG